MLVSPLRSKNILLFVVLPVGIALLLAFLLLNSFFFVEKQPITLTLDSDVQTVEAYWRNEIESKGAQEAYAFFKIFYDGYPHKAHAIAHVFGATLYDEVGLDGLSICDNAFGNGCFHAVVASAIIHEGDQVLLKLGRTCQEKVLENTTACLHGIGHGLMEFSGDDKLFQALGKCSDLSFLDVYEAKETCESGVLMDYTVPLDGEARALDQENYFALCEASEMQPYLSSCFYSLPHWWFGATDLSAPDVLNLCGEIDAAYKQDCYQGAGVDMPGHLDYNQQEILETCAALDEDAYNWCLEANAGTLISLGLDACELLHTLGRECEVPFSAQEEEINRCEGSHECLRELVLRHIEEEGLKEAFLLIEHLNMQVPGFRPSCHGFVSSLGPQIFERYPEFRSFALTPETTWCNYGLQQSFPEAILHQTKDLSLAKDYCVYTKEQLGNEVPGAEAECYRGIGRGIPHVVPNRYYGDEEKFVSYALEQCTSLPSYQDSCVDGFFNAFAYATLDHRFDFSPNEENPWYVCDILTDYQRKGQCHANYKPVALWVEEKKGGSSASSAAPTEDSLKDIAFSHGYTWTSEHVLSSESLSDALESCAQTYKDGYRYCIWGVGVGITKNGPPQLQYQHLGDFCKIAREKGGVTPEDCPAAQALGYLTGLYSKEKYTEIEQYLRDLLGNIVAIEVGEQYGY